MDNSTIDTSSVKLLKDYYYALYNRYGHRWERSPNENAKMDEVRKQIEALGGEVDRK